MTKESSAFTYLRLLAQYRCILFHWQVFFGFRLQKVTIQVKYTLVFFCMVASRRKQEDLR